MPHLRTWNLYDKNESCHTHEWVEIDQAYFNCNIRMCQCHMPHLRTRNDKNESCHTHEWVKIDEAYFNCIIRMCQRDMPHLRTSTDSFVCAHWLLHMVDMAHLYVWHTAFNFKTWHTTLILSNQHKCIVLLTMSQLSACAGSAHARKSLEKESGHM